MFLPKIFSKILDSRVGGQIDFFMNIDLSTGNSNRKSSKIDHDLTTHCLRCSFRPQGFMAAGNAMNPADVAFLEMTPPDPIRNGQVPHELHNADEVFDPPFLITDGDDAPARHPTLERLWRQGTENRRILEESQSFTVGVLFKIHTNNPVKDPPAMASTFPPAKLSNRKKKAPPAPTFAVIDSSTFKNNRVLDFRVFLYGKSLNEFKDLIGDVCDEYEKGTKKVVLDSPLTPMLTWNATVGTKKLQLVDYDSYQEFVQNLGKSRSRKGTINITLEKPQVKEKRDAQASGGVAYIKDLNGPTTIEEELAASKEETIAAKQETMEVKAAKALELEASTLYSDHLERALGGDGTILTAPWDPTYFYRFTHRCAFIWAKAIRDGYTTRSIPPSTTEYKKEMAKNAVHHHDASVDTRVKRRYPAPVPGPRSPRRRSPGRSTSAVIAKHRDFFSNAPVKIKKEPVSPSSHKRPLEHSSSGTPAASFKKIKQESASGETPAQSISLLTSEDIPEGDVSTYDSDVEVVTTHSTLLERFLAECDIPKDDINTRNILRKAKVSSWTDLIPSVQMTANVLTAFGMQFDIAKHLIDAAQEAHNELQDTNTGK
ncbi:hypothetical protein DFH28DRAFT_1200583 [Melampsora americana]|nr:hypothetical protein DFH28DRAFT_1200583 [Melampsora americana]